MARSVITRIDRELDEYLADLKKRMDIELGFRTFSKVDSSSATVKLLKRGKVIIKKVGKKEGKLFWSSL